MLIFRQTRSTEIRVYVCCHPDQFQEDGTSVSVLQWTPSIEDEGKFLVCRATNPKLQEAGIEERWKLKIHCEYIGYCHLFHISQLRHVPIRCFQFSYFNKLERFARREYGKDKREVAELHRNLQEIGSRTVREFCIPARTKEVKCLWRKGVGEIADFSTNIDFSWKGGVPCYCFLRNTSQPC